MADVNTQFEESAVTLLLRRVPDLQRRAAAERLAYFADLCVWAIGKTDLINRESDLTAVLLGMAAVSGVPLTEAVQLMGQVARDHGLIIRAFERAKTTVGTMAGDLASAQQGRACDDDRKSPEKRRRPNSKTSCCEAWLQRILADRRPHPSLELQRRARQDGLIRAGKVLTRSSIFKAARKRLGIVITRRGFGPGASYYWSLPTPSRPLGSF